jgi:hypothetical protein
MKKLLCITFLAVAANATTIFVDSDASNTFNDSGHATVDLTGTLHPNSGWAAALDGSSWISYGSTGDAGDPGYINTPNGTIVIFTTQFILGGAITGANLTVLADDSTSVILNGNLLIAANTVPGSNCAGHPIGCLTSTEGVFTFAQLAPFLVDGTNTLAFGVQQVAFSSFGLDFAGNVDTGGSTPEPATVGLIGAGLVAFATLRRRK